MHGNNGIESTNTGQWKHTKQAFYALEKGYIGNILTESNKKEWCLVDAASLTPTTSLEEWSLENRIHNNDDTYFFYFKNPKYSVKLAFEGVDFIGKHWVLCKNHKSRLYTNCLCLDKQVEKYRESMIKALENDIDGTNHQIEPIKLPEYSDVLTLVIKEYKMPLALSHVVTSAKLGTNFLLEGPIVCYNL